MRKETLHKYIRLAQKSDLEIWIPITSIDREVSRRCWALNLDRYNYREAVEETGAFSIDPPTIEKCRAICPTLMNSFSSLVSWSNLHDFNTRLEQHISWSIKHIIDLFNYKWSVFCQKISQFYMTYVLTSSTYVLTMHFVEVLKLKEFILFLTLYCHERKLQWGSNFEINSITVSSFEISPLHNYKHKSLKQLDIY